MVNEFQTFLFILSRPELKNDICELTTTTGLLFINLLMLNARSKSFLVGYLRSTLINFNLKLPLKTINDDLQVKFSHST